MSYYILYYPILLYYTVLVGYSSVIKEKAVLFHEDCLYGFVFCCYAEQIARWLRFITV